MPPHMPAAKFRPVWPITTIGAAGHIAAVIAHAFDDGHPPLLRTAKRSPATRPDVGLTSGSSVQADVAHDDVLAGGHVGDAAGIY